MQAEGVEVHDAANTAERESLMMAVADEVLAAVFQEPPPAPDRGPGRGLQRRKSDDRWHTYPLSRSRMARVAGDWFRVKK